MADMEIVLALAVIAGVVAIRHVAARRFARGEGRWAWLIFAPTILGALAVVWSSLRVLSADPVMGVVLGVVGGVSLVLIVRTVRAWAVAGGPDVLANPSSPLIDYMIWASVGAPLVIAALLLVLLATGRLDGTR